MGAQNNSTSCGYGSPWHHQEGHGKLLQQNPWQHQHTQALENNSAFSLSGGSSPLSRNPLCHPKSMVWTRMLIEKINRNHTCISYMIMMMTLF